MNIFTPISKMSSDFRPCLERWSRHYYSGHAERNRLVERTLAAVAERLLPNPEISIDRALFGLLNEVFKEDIRPSAMPHPEPTVRVTSDPDKDHKQCPSGKTALLLEDQGLIALDIEDVLIEAGFPSIRTFPSCDQAQHWLSENTPAVAVVDLRLKDGPCIEVAHTLAKRGVPFVVYSGDVPGLKDLPPVFHGRPFLNKPCEPGDLLSAVRSVLF